MADAATPGDQLVSVIRQRVAFMKSQVQCGMAQSVLADSQSVQLISMIQHTPSLSIDDGIKLTDEIVNGPWTSQHRSSLCTAINDVVTRVNSKKAKRDQQMVDSPHLWLTSDDWTTLTDDRWGVEAKTATVAMRLFKIGVSCPRDELCKRAAALVMRASYTMDQTIMHDPKEKQRVVHKIRSNIKSYDASMVPWPFMHITNYPAEPSGMADAQFRHAYKHLPPIAPPDQQFITDVFQLQPAMVYRGNHLSLGGSRGSHDGGGLEAALRELTGLLGHGGGSEKHRGRGARAPHGAQVPPHHVPAALFPSTTTPAGQPYAPLPGGQGSMASLGAQPLHDGAPPVPAREQLPGAVFHGGVPGSLSGGLPLPKTAPPQTPAGVARDEPLPLPGHEVPAEGAGEAPGGPGPDADGSEIGGPDAAEALLGLTQEAATGAAAARKAVNGRVDGGRVRDKAVAKAKAKPKVFKSKPTAKTKAAAKAKPKAKAAAIAKKPSGKAPPPRAGAWISTRPPLPQITANRKMF